VEAHGKGRLKFLDCRSFFLSENEDIDEELMPDSAYPNASGDTSAADPVHHSACIESDHLTRKLSLLMTAIAAILVKLV